MNDRLLLKSQCINCGKGSHEVFLDQVPDRLHLTEPGQYKYVRCKSCSMISLYPPPPLAKIETFYPASFWRSDESVAIAKNALQRFETWYRKRLMSKDFRKLSSYIKDHVRVLDVGCATGDFMKLCQEAGAKAHGIELSRDAVKYCREELGLAVEQGDLVGHDFQGQKFDVITYNAVLEHVPNPYEHLIACKKLLSPKGRLLINALPNIESLGFRLGRRSWLGLDFPRHLHQYSIKSLLTTLEGCGYRIEEIDTISPRFNPPSLIATLIPALHRHHFDEYKARTGRNPIVRKALLLGLIEAIRPFDWLFSKLGLGEHINVVAVPK